MPHRVLVPYGHCEFSFKCFRRQVTFWKHCGARGTLQMLNRSPGNVSVCPAMAVSCPGAAHVPWQAATVTSRPFLRVSSYQQLNSSCQQDLGCAVPSRKRRGRAFISFGLRTLQQVQRHEQVSSVPHTRMADTRGGVWTRLFNNLGHH